MPHKDPIKHKEYQRAYQRTKKFKEYQKQYNDKKRDKISNTNKLYRQENWEWFKNYMREYKKTDKNKNYMKLYLKEYRQNNKDKNDIYMREYRNRNKEKCNAISRKHSIKRYKQIICMDDKTINQKSLINILEYQNYKCNYCWCDLNRNEKHLDHIIPLSKD
jgi:hypothetical protein